MSIIGVEILNEGGGLSVDDITNEEQMTYVARAKTAWVPWIPDDVANADPNSGRFFGELGPNEAGTSTVFPTGLDGGPDLISQYKSWLNVGAGGAATP